MYRISEPGFDPVAAEKFYSKIEGKIAPLLRNLNQEKRSPNKDEMDSLCIFMALQWARVPAFRPKMLAIAHKINRANMARALKSRASWSRVLKKMNVPFDSPEADYDKMREFVESEQYSLSAEKEWYIQQGIESANMIAPSLQARHWQAYVSKKGSFIASDNPVVLEGGKKEMVGFANAGVIIYPLSRHVVLHGTIVKMAAAPLTEMLIARLNTLMMLTANEQLFSWKPDFCWLDHSEQYQTDWRLFARDKFV